MIHKLEIYIKRIRWKTFFFQKKNDFTNEITANCGKTQPKYDQLNHFESHLYEMVQNIDLMNVTSNFQARLSDVVRNIKKNPKLLIPADRTNNLHKLTTDEFN